MKLRTALVLGSLGLAASSLAFAAQGCSSDEPASGGSGKQPPARPAGPATSSSDNRTFAIKSLDLGLNNGWRKLGYDLDKKVSASGATDICKPRPGSDKKVHADGDQGIDNAFGQFIVPQLTNIPNVTDLQGSVNTAFTSGQFGVLFQIKGLVDTLPAATGLSGQIFAGLELGSAPKFDGTDKYRVNKSLLTGGTVESGSKIKFSNSYIADGQFVSGDPSTVTLSLTLVGISLSIDIINAVVTWDVKSKSGMIAGIIAADKLGEEIKRVVPRIPQLACNTTIANTVESIVATIVSNADIPVSGSPNPSSTCDGISVGLGFTLGEVANPTEAADSTPPAPVDCNGDGGTSPADAGTGG
jgi:hypothetical protein